MVEPFAFALFFVLAAALWLRRGSMIVTASLLIWDWGLCVLLAQVDGSGLNWFAMFCVDFGTALLLLLWHTRKWQLAVISIFVLMIAAHIGFAVVGVGAQSIRIYLTALSWFSWTQLGIVALKGIGDVAERLGYQPRVPWRVLSGSEASGFGHRKGGEA